MGAKSKSAKPRARVRTSHFDRDGAPALLEVGGMPASRWEDHPPDRIRPIGMWLTIRQLGLEASIHLSAERAEQYARAILAKVDELRAAPVEVLSSKTGAVVGRAG